MEMPNKLQPSLYRLKQRVSHVSKSCKSYHDKEFCSLSKRSEVRLLLLWMILCSIGHVCQVYHISSQYFKYGITTNVQVITEDTLMLPSVVFCFHLLQVTKWQDMTHEERLTVLRDEVGNDIFNYSVQEEDEESVKKIPSIIISKSHANLVSKIQANSNLQALNVSRIFDVTYKFENMFDSFIVFVQNDSELGVSRKLMEFSSDDPHIHDIFSVTEFLKDMYRCYSLDFKKAFRLVNHFHLARQAEAPGVISGIFLKPERIRNTTGMYYIPNHNDRQLHHGFYATLPMQAATSVRHHISYDVFEAILLKAPYETQCIDYTDFGFESRGECFESCIRNESISATRMIHPSSNVYAGETKQVIKILDIVTNKDNIRNVMDKLEDICDERCQANDCTSITYIPKKMSTLSEPDMVMVIIMAPQSPKVRATCQKAMSAIQYLTDVGSTFGFWLGVSAFGFFGFVKRSISRVFQAFSTSDQEKKHNKRRQKAPEAMSSNPWVLVRSPDAAPDPGWKAVKTDASSFVCKVSRA